MDSNVGALKRYEGKVDGKPYVQFKWDEVPEHISGYCGLVSTMKCDGYMFRYKIDKKQVTQSIMAKRVEKQKCWIRIVYADGKPAAQLRLRFVVKALDDGTVIGGGSIMTDVNGNVRLYIINRNVRLTCSEILSEKDLREGVMAPPNGEIEIKPDSGTGQLVLRNNKPAVFTTGSNVH